MEIELSRIFVKVIQHGGFSKAAQALGLPKSTISKAVSRLEKETGTKLILRTTRSQTLTAAGRAFYETCLQPVQVLEDAQKSLYGADNIVSGKVKITAPEDLGYHVVATAIGCLCHKYPLLEFELSFTNERLDLVREGYDFAIRIGNPGSNSLLQRKLAEIELVPVASPKYLKSKRKISVPKDLTEHGCITISSSSTARIWTFKNEKRATKIKVRSQIDVNHVSSILRMAVSGAGIAFLPKYICQADLERGTLVRILPQWTGDRMGVYLVSPTSTTASSRLHIVSSEISSALKAALDA